MSARPDAPDAPDALFYELRGGSTNKRCVMNTCGGTRRESASGASGASVRQAAASLESLARAVGRLSPDRRDPERFHMDRSEIVADLRRLARQIGRAA